MDLKKILPTNGPSIDEVKKYIEKYLEEIIVIKCGGSVLLDKNLFRQFIEDVSIIYKLGLSVIVVHGGGKNIKKKLDELNIDSKFFDGLRVTDKITIKVGGLGVRIDPLVRQLFHNSPVTHFNEKHIRFV